MHPLCAYIVTRSVQLRTEELNAEANRWRDRRIDLADLQRATIEARQALEEAANNAAASAEEARFMATVLDRVLDTLAAPTEPTGPDPVAATPVAPALAPLSPREREVLTLVAEGRSNKAIAAALYVSPNTVKTHVASLLTKLQAESRVQLATIAHQPTGHSQGHPVNQSLMSIEGWDGNLKHIATAGAALKSTREGW
jgi:DNA-binding CsgD family transcriptional regulator